MRIVLHRGNTYNAVENSLDAMNTNINNSEITFGSDEVSLEIDVILKPPFVIHHTTTDIVKNVFRKAEPNSTHFNSIKNKYVWELSELDISHVRHIKSNTKPMILKEVLEHAELNGYKLYLDIKVPDYFVKNYYKYFLLNEHTRIMMNIINSYHHVVTCVISFSFYTSLIIKQLSDSNIDRGVFYWNKFNINFINRMYHRTIIHLLKPTILSYSLETVQNDDQVLNNPNMNTTRYIWTIHKTELPSLNTFLQNNNLIPIVDMFDK